MRRMSECVPVIPQGSSFYDLPFVSENELLPTSRKSQAIRMAQVSALQNPVHSSLKTQTAYLNNMARETINNKTTNQVRVDTFEVEFLERIGNQLFTMWNSGEISEDEFFKQVAKERQRLRFELGQTPSESEYLLTTETESENLVELDPRTISDEETGMGIPVPELVNETKLELQRVSQELRKRGGARPTAGRMTREEKQFQIEMLMEGKGKPTKTGIKEGRKAVEEILAEVFSRVEV